MTRSILLLLALGCTITCRAAESIISIPAGSHNNTLTLSIENGSGHPSFLPLTVRILQAPPEVTFRPDVVTPPPPPPGQAANAVFVFDVSPDVPLSRRDTVSITITASTGELWTHSVIWTFTGPDRVRLDQNYPNPFNPVTTIPFALPADTHLSLVVYDRLGRTVRTLLDGRHNAGCHTVVWDGKNDGGTCTASGVYFCRLTTADLSLVQSMLLVK